MQDGSQLWKWIQCYINNWRCSPQHIQSVRSALAQCYWQGVISWNEFIECEPFLTSKTQGQSARSAPDLLLALSHIGKTIKGRYTITDIRGFLDQGIIFQAEYGSRKVALLCLTNNISTMPELDLPQLVKISSVVKTTKRVYLELPDLIGQPLCVWLMEQHPTGLPASLARFLLEQIYQLLRAVESLDAVLAGIHPGQLFIDSDSLNLQWIPCAAKLTPSMRGQLYQMPDILLTETNANPLGYRLMAIAYELFTGSVPSSQFEVHKVLSANIELNKWQKKQIEQCLTGKRLPSLSQAASIFNASKKHVIRDTALLALASVFALAAFTWQGMNYIPVWFANQEVVDSTIVIQQSTKDSHVNLLKAAFFTQIQEHNYAGAAVSWQALQKILPNDDVFIQKIGPELLAQQNHIPPEPLLIVENEPVPVVLDSFAGGEMTLAALPPLPADTQVVTTTPVIAPHSAPQSVPEVAYMDPCLRALHRQNDAPAVACIDTIANNQLGPRLLAARTAQDQLKIVTQQAISVTDYNQYCLNSGACTVQQKAAVLDLELKEIEDTVQEYNTYCLTSALCDPLDVPLEPVLALTPDQINAYSSWLTQETGFVYRVPTIAEWQQITTHATFEQLQGGIKWLVNDQGQWVTTLALDPHAAQKNQHHDPSQVAFHLIRENNL